MEGGSKAINEMDAGHDRAGGTEGQKGGDWIRKRSGKKHKGHEASCRGNCEERKRAEFYTD